MNRRRAMTALDIVALSIATIGAINWGLSAANFNLVRRLFGRGSLLERTVYAVVGLAGLDLAWLTARFIAGGYQTPQPPPSMVRERFGAEAQQFGQQIQRGARRASQQVQQGLEQTERAGQQISETGEEVQRGTYPPSAPHGTGMRP